MPLDILTFRDEDERAKLIESQRRRAVGRSEADIEAAVNKVQQVVDADNRMRALATEFRDIGKQIGILQKKIGVFYKSGGAKKGSPELTALLEEKLAFEGKLTANAEEKKTVQAQLRSLVGSIGNLVHLDSPVKKDEEDTDEPARVWGQCRQPEPELLHHHQLLHRIGGFDAARGVKVGGHRAYFLTGPGVLLNEALKTFATQFLAKREYKLVAPPLLMNADVMAQTAQLEDFHEQLYKVVGKTDASGATAADGEEAKYLIATSEQPISAMHKDEWMEEKSLPIKYGGISQCFRKEAGASGKDVWGIFRVHQFEKVEQFVICKPEESWKFHDEIVHTAEEFYQALGLAYKVVDIPTGELNNAAARKYDLEAWFPTLGVYRELVSASNCTDYQSRAMETRCGHKKAGDRAKRYVHMLNSTLCATTRTICCILENYQTPTGVRVPEVLQPFVGTDFFPFVQELPAQEGAAVAAAAAGARGQQQGQSKSGGKGQKNKKGKAKGK